MTYRVVFAKRFQSDGQASSLDPTAELDMYLPDGVVADKAFVERFEPEAKHSQEVLDEDDAFLGMAAAEVWEYEVVNDRAQEFVDAIRNSGTVMEYEVLDAGITEVDEVAGVPLGDGSTRVAADGPGFIEDEPGGQPTVDRAAGETTPEQPHLRLDEADGIVNEGGGIDDLTTVGMDDPGLGLTNTGDTGPDDWAADTGPSRTSGRGVVSDHQADEASTLAPDRK